MARGILIYNNVFRGRGHLLRVCLVSMITVIFIFGTSSVQKTLHTSYEQFQRNDSSSDHPVIHQDVWIVPPEPTITSDHKPPVTRVIVAAYYRSGSSLTGKLFDESPDSFYWFEPLQGLYNSYRRKRRTKRHPVLNGYDMDGIVPDTNISGLHHTALKAMSDILSCNFEDLPCQILETNFLAQSSSANVKPYIKCLKKSNSNRTLQVDLCLDHLQSGCEVSTMRAIKTIRLSLKLVSRLMKEHSDIVVIHLVRDPRGIIQSRNEIVPYTVRSFERDIQVTCSMMEQDLETFEQLSELYPNRITRIRFEDLASSPYEVAKSLYGFLKLNLPDHVRTWIERTTSYDRDIGRELSLKRNATMVLKKWRERLSKYQILAIQEGCGDVMEYLNYDLLTPE